MSASMDARIACRRLASDSAPARPRGYLADQPRAPGTIRPAVVVADSAPRVVKTQPIPAGSRVGLPHSANVRERTFAPLGLGPSDAGLNRPPLSCDQFSTLVDSRGLARNEREAIRRFRRQTEQADPFRNRLRGRRNGEEAVRCHRRAADRATPQARQAWASCTTRGVGVRRIARELSGGILLQHSRDTPMPRTNSTACGHAWRPAIRRDALPVPATSVQSIRGMIPTSRPTAWPMRSAGQESTSCGLLRTTMTARAGCVLLFAWCLAVPFVCPALGAAQETTPSSWAPLNGRSASSHLPLYVRVGHGNADGSGGSATAGRQVHDERRARVLPGRQVQAPGASRRGQVGPHVWDRWTFEGHSYSQAIVVEWRTALTQVLFGASEAFALQVNPGPRSAWDIGLRREIPRIGWQAATLATRPDTPVDSSSAAVTVRDSYAGDCLVIVTVDRAVLQGAVVRVELNHGMLASQSVDQSDVLAFPVSEPLVEGDQLRVHVNRRPILPDVSVTERPGGGSTIDACRSEDSDEAGEGFLATLDVGVVVDNFVPGGRPIRPLDGVALEDRFRPKSRSFVRLLMGSPLFDILGQPLSLNGETAFATRSAICEPTECLKDTTQILEAARTTEAFLTGRLRLGTLQRSSRSPVGVHYFARLGIYGVAGRRNFGRSFDSLGLDLRVEDGPYEGSYAAIGLLGGGGLLSSSGNRFRYDAFVTWPIGWLRFLAPRTFRPFVQIRIDSDWGVAPDALQVLYGVTVEPAQISGWW